MVNKLVPFCFLILSIVSCSNFSGDKTFTTINNGDIFTAASVPAGYNLVWSDEFNGNGQPDPANWNYHVGNGWNPGLPGFQGWGNREKEWYRPENCYQSGGNLVIRADSPNYIWGIGWFPKSGRMTTQGKLSWQYGYIEARIKFPTGQGNWCAFWMMGTSCTNSSGEMVTSSYNPSATYYSTMINNWPSCGEVDIAEHTNASSTGFANCFWDLRTGVYPWTLGQITNYGNTNVPYGDLGQFHIYGFQWDSTNMRWFVDGVQTHIVDITAATMEEFRKPFYLLLNMAFGGTLNGYVNPVDESALPMYMYVDYIRVYQAGASTNTSSSSSSSSSESSSGPATTIDSGGVYQIVSVNHGKAMEVAGSSTTAGTSVQQNTLNTVIAQPNQKWRIDDMGDGYRLTSLSSGMVLDCSGGGTGNGTVLLQWPDWGIANPINQRWAISLYGTAWKFSTKQSGARCIDVPADSSSDGVQLIIWDDHGGNNQRWYLYKQ